MRQHLVSAVFHLTCVRPYPDPRVSYCPPFPRVRGPLSRSARQLYNPLSDPCVSYFPRPAVPCIPIRASATLSPLPRIRCPYAPFSRVKPFSHVTALARVLTAIVRPVARQVPPDPIRASATIPPLPRSACQLPSHLILARQDSLPIRASATPFRTSSTSRVS